MSDDQESGTEDDEILLKTENVFFYNIPFNINQKPGSLRAKDWDLSNPAGCCSLTVAAAGICCHIHLEDESGQVFGQAVVDFYPGDFGSSSVVSAVTDSSRYFTLKMQQRSGVFDYIGLGFSNHKDSSDFSRTLEKYFSSQKQLIKDIDMVDVDVEMEYSTSTAPIKTELAENEQETISSLASLNSTFDDEEATSSSINETLTRHEPVHSEVMEEPSPLVPTANIAGKENHSSDTICKSASLTKSGQIPLAHRYSQLGNVFKCHLCPLPIYHAGDFSSCDFEKPIINHWVEVHGIETPNICRTCSLLFESEMEAAKHEQLLHSRKCPVCSLILSSSTELKKHKSFHNISSNVTLPTTAKQSYGNLIWINTSEVSPQQDQIPSDLQQAPNPSPESIETSLDTISKSGDTKNAMQKGAHNYSQPGNVFKCHLCPLTINHSGDFSSADFEVPIINHWLGVHGIENPNICSTCSLVFENETEAAKHIQLQHNYKCQQCSMTLSSATKLKKHMSFHSSSCDGTLPTETEDHSGNLVLESITTEVILQDHSTNDLQQASDPPAESMETSLNTVNKSISAKNSRREGTASSELYKPGSACSVLRSNGAHRYIRLRNVFKCHLCPFKTKHSNNFSSADFETPIVNHWVEVHGIKTPNICRKCSLVFESEMQAVEHLKLQHKFKCQQCSMILPSVNKLIKHVSFHTSCSETPPTETEHHYSGNLVLINTTQVSPQGLLTKDLQEAPNPSAESMETPVDTIISKSVCPKTPRRKRTKLSKFAKLQLRKAKRTKEDHCYSQPGNIFKCHLCPLAINHSGDFSSFDLETPIINHWAEAHGIQDANICRMCKLLFQNKKQAFKHVKLRHNYKCKQCSRIFPSETNLKDHQSLPCSYSYSKTVRAARNRGNPALPTWKNRPIDVQGTSAEWRQDGSSSTNLKKPIPSVARRSELFNKYHMYRASVAHPAGAHRYNQPGNVFKCHLCPLTINHSGDISSCDLETPIINHWVEFHGIGNPSMCRKCSLVFENELDADKHVQFLHNHKCHQCSKILSSATKLKKHVSVRCKALLTDHDPANLVFPTETSRSALQVQISPEWSPERFPLVSPEIPNLGNTTEVSPHLDFTSDFQEAPGLSAESIQTSLEPIKKISCQERRREQQAIRSKLSKKYRLYRSAVSHPAGAHLYNQPGNVFKCHLCQLTINHSGDVSSCDFEKPILNHWVEAHGIGNPSMCRKCFLVFENEMDADKHTLFIHNHKCLQCSVIFSSANKLKTHVSFHCTTLLSADDHDPGSL